ncbi:YcxB family protein [Microbacterium aerolatum]|uniref:YcxB-like protein domain-containing protein n=1 Tax=Microbacterium aerolatum TaxID=153731 RepID=A0A511AGP7_9MICO|nr:YcxB family protein [Microbacterium aerolatum]MCK3770399.1 YcxB family protein [Microbacterium aerolatum]GEK87344.1 hypothetical protein MAE01_25200 [Microbacterium aerolatum]GGB13765.1 hypothetical protein GCM10007198_00250 [Microbacterium aerolatum]
MTNGSSSRSLVVDAELLRGMTWDTVIYTLTRPLAVIAYAALVAAFILNAVVLSMIGGADPEQTTTLTWTMIAIAALVVASIIFTRASTRRALSAAMPSGSAVRVELEPESVRMIAKNGVSDVAYSTFRSVRIGKHAAVLRLRGSSVVTVIPRSLLSDADIALLKSKI